MSVLADTTCVATYGACLAFLCLPALFGSHALAFRVGSIVSRLRRWVCAVGLDDVVLQH